MRHIHRQMRHIHRQMRRQIPLTNYGNTKQSLYSNGSVKQLE
jgi:hypothetical protein